MDDKDHTRMSNIVDDLEAEANAIEAEANALNERLDNVTQNSNAHFLSANTRFETLRLEADAIAADKKNLVRRIGEFQKNLVRRIGEFHAKQQE